MTEIALCPLATKLVNEVFMVFYALCNGFERQFEDELKLNIAKTQWTIGFMEQGIKSEKQIAQGISRVRAEKSIIYAPTLGQFLEWCELASRGSHFLSKEKAYKWAYKILNSEDVSELTEDQLTVILHALSESGRHYMRNNSADKTEKMFFNNYEDAIKQMLAGELRPIPKAIEGPQQDDDPWKTMRKYGVLPQYASTIGNEANMKTMRQILSTPNKIFKKLPK